MCVQRWSGNGTVCIVTKELSPSEGKKNATMVSLEAQLALVGVVLIGVLAIWYIIGIYNQLVSLHNRVEQSRQNIDVLLTQRQDELTKLIEAADTFMEHEEDVLIELTDAREQGENAETPHQQANADQRVRKALSDFRARAENYPNLRSHQNVLQLQERISDIETQITTRRELYNETVTQYNTRREQIPYVLFASLPNRRR